MEVEILFGSFPFLTMQLAKVVDNSTYFALVKSALMEEFPYADCCINVAADEEDILYGEMEVDLLYHLKGICSDCIHMN